MLTIKRLSLDDARLMIAGAETKARQIGVAMCISVVDESGNPIAFCRMDGAKVLSVTLAEDKAYTAAIARNPTHFYGEKAVPGSSLYGISSACSGRFTIVGGGYPVTAGDDVVGGIGASSGTPEQDMEVARAGIEAWE